MTTTKDGKIRLERFDGKFFNVAPETPVLLCGGDHIPSREAPILERPRGEAGETTVGAWAELDDPGGAVVLLFPEDKASSPAWRCWHWCTLRDRGGFQR